MHFFLVAFAIKSYELMDGKKKAVCSHKFLNTEVTIVSRKVSRRQRLRKFITVHHDCPFILNKTEEDKDSRYTRAISFTCLALICANTVRNPNK